jgi:tetratricopeptide (TPR) repeat protein
VRYVLEGSVRRSGSQVRVNTQLIDADTGAHLWVERFDRDTGDLFALQDEITRRIAVGLNLELIDAEAARPTDHHPDALDYILRGRAALSKPTPRDSYAEAIDLFECALALDPRSADAQGWLASTLACRSLDQMTASTASDIARAEGLIGQALAAWPRLPLAHFAKGELRRAQRRIEEAIPGYETAIAFNRNWAYAIYALGMCKLLTGPIEEAIPLAEQAIRLSPRDPQIGLFYLLIGWVHLVQSRTDEGIRWLEKSRSACPARPAPHVSLAAAYALKGETARAAAELAEARSLSLDGRLSSIARLKASRDFHALFEATFFAGLRKAGMPEK